MNIANYRATLLRLLKTNIKPLAALFLGVLLPLLIFDEQLRQGRLQRVLPEWGCKPSEIQVTFPTGRGMLPAVRFLIDFLAEHPPEASETSGLSVKP